MLSDLENLKDAVSFMLRGVEPLSDIACFVPRDRIQTLRAVYRDLPPDAGKQVQPCKPEGPEVAAVMAKQEGRARDEVFTTDGEWWYASHPGELPPHIRACQTSAGWVPSFSRSTPAPPEAVGTLMWAIKDRHGDFRKVSYYREDTEEFLRLHRTTYSDEAKVVQVVVAEKQ